MSRRHGRGFTLVEMLIGLALGLLVTFAINGVIDLSVRSKRNIHASGDLNQLAGYVELMLDRSLRSAGSGFGQDTRYWGCALQASKSSTQILPMSSAPPAPFGSVTIGTTGLFRLAPVLIAAGQTTPAVSGQSSDALIVMSGQSGQAELALPFVASSTATTVKVDSAIGLRANDIVLLADKQRLTGTVAKPCLVSQVSSTYTSASDGNISLAGTYYAATINSNSITGLSSASAVFNLGNSTGNLPMFQIIGVGDNNTLYSYDLLKVAATSPVPIADSVFELKALYGVDTTGDGSIDSWQSPSGTYALSALANGTTAATSLINQIKALRVGVILRANRVGPASNAPTSVNLFSSLGTSLTYTRSLSTTERAYRYQTVEFTVPIVNMVLSTLP